jgi:hypothetical protein
MIRGAKSSQQQKIYLKKYTISKLLNFVFMKEPVGQYAGNGSQNDQMTPQEHSSCRDSTQSLNCLFTEETNKLKRFSGDIFKYPSTGMF